MADIFQDVADSLTKLENAVAAVLPQTQEFIDIWGWNNPVLTKDEIAERAYDLAERVRRIRPEQKTELHTTWLTGVPAKIDKFISSTLPNMTGGNSSTVCSLYGTLLAYIEGRLPPDNWPTDWEAAAAAGEMPAALARRLRSLEARLVQLEPRTLAVDDKIKVIEEAHTAAENLPIDMQSLQEARIEIDVALKKVTTDKEKSEKALVSVNSQAASIKAQSVEADKLMQNIDSAYRASTSKALADAFATRAWWLQAQTWVFVLLLIAALTAGGALGFRRVSMLEKLISNPVKVDATLLWMNVALSFLSVAAPVWLAWVATKQISQRFRLAEDYSFKAAVAKAYEGYRREAASVDPLFVTRLFGSALSRLEEAPLRLVDEDNYGSPFHELTASPAFRDALGLVPALRDKYKSLLEAIGSRQRKGGQEAAGSNVEATSGEAL